MYILQVDQGMGNAGFWGMFDTYEAGVEWHENNKDITGLGGWRVHYIELIVD